MSDATRTQEPGDIPRTEAVLDFDVLATSAGVPSHTTLARAGGKPLVPGYELLESIGKGGMGIVYRARQLALDRDLALKFLRDDFDARSATGLRFLEEAKITAQLQHPGIPAVHDVGTLPDGRPYLAMKLIRGRTLDVMLKEQGPGSTKWLSVFEAICQAVGFAHTHGVIHRDLKPSNIMVGAFGEVQVMDWGLAKVLGRESKLPDSAESEAPADDMVQSSRSGGSIETRAGSYLGTPAFMAPEQATGKLELLGVRTDVFGLGAVLCMLLTGQPPYLGGNAETTRLMAASVNQTEVVGRLDSCGADPDLIDLCRRCLDGDPRKRPADGAVVARQVASLRSYAEERAKQAELDVARTEVAAAEQHKRRRVMMAAGGALAIVLSAGIVASSIGFLRAREAKRIAQQNEQKAVEANAISDSTLQFFLNDLLRQADAEAQADSLQAAGSGLESKENPTIRELLDRAAEQLTPEKIERRFQGRPVVQATILKVVGKTYRGIGEPVRAIDHLKRAADLDLACHGETDKTTLDTRSILALAYIDAGRFTDAVDLFETIRDVYLIKHADELDHGNLLNSMNNLGNAYRLAGKTAAAIKLYEQVRKDFRRKWGPDDQFTLLCEDNLAGAYQDARRFDAAIQLYQSVLDARTRVQGGEHPKTLVTLANLAETHRLKGGPDEVATAALLARKAIDPLVRVYGGGHPYTLFARNILARSNLDAAKFDADTGRDVSTDPRVVEALTLFESIVAGAAVKYDADHLQRIVYDDLLAEAYYTTKQSQKAIAQYEKVRDRLVARRGLGDARTRTTLNNLAHSYCTIGDPAKAVPIFTQIYTLDRNDTARGPGHPDTVTAAVNLAYAARKCGDDAAALPLLEEAARSVVRLQYRHDNCISIFQDLAMLYEQQKRYADAEPWRRNLVLCAKQEQGVESPNYLGGLVQLGLNLMEQKKCADAVVPLKECVAARQKLQAGQWQLFNTQSILGAALLESGQFKEAEPLLLLGYEGLLKTAATLPAAVAQYPQRAGERLLKCYEATQQIEKAKILAKTLAKSP